MLSSKQIPRLLSVPIHGGIRFGQTLFLEILWGLGTADNRLAAEAVTDDIQGALDLLPFAKITLLCFRKQASLCRGFSVSESTCADPHQTHSQVFKAKPAQSSLAALIRMFHEVM